MLPFTDKSRYHLERQRDASCFHAVLIFYLFFSFCCPPSTPHLGSDSGMNGHQLWGWDKCKKGVGWKEKRGEEIQERVRVGIHGGCEREAIEEYGQWQSGRRREEVDEDGQTRGWSPEDGERCSGEVGALECSLIYLTQAVRWPLLLFLGYLGTWQVEPALNQEQLESFGEWTEEPSRHYTGIDLLFKKLHWLQSCCCRARRDGCDTVWLMIFAVQLTWLVVWDKPCYTTFTV